jgi:cytochrome P450
VSTPSALQPPPGSGLRPIPGDSGPPVIGSTWQVFHRPLSWTRHRYDQYGPVSWTRAFGRRMVTGLGPEAAETVLVDRDRVFSQSGWRFFVEAFFPRGLMVLDFDEHRHHRRAMQAAFTRKRMHGYIQSMAPVIADGLADWEPYEAFHVYPALKQLTLDVATKVFMGTELGGEADRINTAFVDSVRAASAYVRAPVPGGRWRRGQRGRARLEEFFTRRLPDKRASDGDDLFAALAHAETEDGEAFSDADVVNHMIFLMMAAHDTSTITLSAMVDHLGRHPEWQQRCRDECQALDKPALDYDDLDELPSLQLVMQESLRLLPPVPSLPRRAVADTAVCGCYVPAGTMLHVSPQFTHHMAEWWPSPNTFDPERFAEHRREDKAHGYAYIPFGGGAHKCIGMGFGQMEIKAVMHQLLQRFRWQVPPGYEMPVDRTSLPRPADGLPLQLQRMS